MTSRGRLLPGVLSDDHKEGTRRPFRLPVALFPVLNRIQRETKLRGKLGLTQSHPGAQFSHVHLWRRDVGDTHADRLALYPVACLLCAAQQLLSKWTVFRSLLSAGVSHLGFFSRYPISTPVYANDGYSQEPARIPPVAACRGKGDVRSEERRGRKEC